MSTGTAVSSAERSATRVPVTMMFSRSSFEACATAAWVAVAASTPDTMRASIRLDSLLIRISLTRAPCQMHGANVAITQQSELIVKRGHDAGSPAGFRRDGVPRG